MAGMAGMRFVDEYLFQEKLYANPIGSKVAAGAGGITKVKGGDWHCGNVDAWPEVCGYRSQLVSGARAWQAA